MVERGDGEDCVAGFCEFCFFVDGVAEDEGLASLGVAHGGVAFGVGGVGAFGAWGAGDRGAGGVFVVVEAAEEVEGLGRCALGCCDCCCWGVCRCAVHGGNDGFSCRGFEDGDLCLGNGVVG